jgi:hypothetical protein
MKVHDLKTDQEPFIAIWDGLKKHEFRLNDRDFQRGDVLHLRERFGGTYTGRQIIAEVTYVSTGPHYGIPARHVIMSLTVLLKLL